MCRVGVDSPHVPGRNPRPRRPFEGDPRLPEAGSVIERRYRILRLLGEGGMGRVYLVADLLRGEQLVALKTLRRGILPDSAGERFKEEFRAMARLGHPN